MKARRGQWPPAPAGAPSVLEVSDLAVGGLDGVDLSIRAGEVVGLAGLLGSGRSTLLSAIFGLYELPVAW